MVNVQDRLISPVGMVNQFALQTEITGIGALGWVTLGDLHFCIYSGFFSSVKAECCFCSGLLWRLAISSFSTGPIGSFLAGFEFLFSTQSLALTIIRFIPISTIASIHQPIGLYIICTYLFSTRSLFDMARDLASRLAITFLFYGAEQTVSK